MADVPPGVVTVTSTVPVPAGDVAVTVVALTGVTLVAAVAPNMTEEAPVSTVPVMVTVFTPAAGPDVGLIPVTVGAATKVKTSDGETAELKAMLKNKLGREPRLETKIDPTLLGGLVVKVGSRMIDSSLRTKLSGLRAAMKGNM